MMTTPSKAGSAYILGHADPELQRLIRQAEFWQKQTSDFLRRSGLRPGMKVLDLGSGAGDVALIAAALVGPTGTVLGVERAAAAVALANGRANEVHWDNVRFVQGDISDYEPDHAFDAIIGRLVLMYLPDPVATLQRLHRHLNPRGVVAFQEFDMMAATSAPLAPIMEQGMRWIRESFRRANFPISMGLQLYALFQQANLPAPCMHYALPMEGGKDSPIYDYFADTIRTLSPLIQKMGLATAQEIDVDTLADRLREEVTRQHGLILPPALIGAWTVVG